MSGTLPGINGMNSPLVCSKHLRSSIVYGLADLSRIWVAGPASITPPAYITMTWSHMAWTTAGLWTSPEADSTRRRQQGVAPAHQDHDGADLRASCERGRHDRVFSERPRARLTRWGSTCIKH